MFVANQKYSRGWGLSFLLLTAALLCLSSCSVIIKPENDTNVVLNLSTRNSGSILPNEADKENCVFDIYVDGVQVASGVKNSFEMKLSTGSRVTIRIVALLNGQAVAEGEQTILVTDGINNMSIGLKKTSSSPSNPPTPHVPTPDPNYVASIADNKYADFSTALTSVNAGQTLTLLSNVNITGTINIEKNMTLDLNGFTLSGNDSFGLIDINANVKLTVQDSSSSQTGTLTKGNQGNGGAVYVNTNASFDLLSGNITGNTSGNGGNVYVANGATFNMRGGKIYENTSNPSQNSKGGAGVAVYGTFNMEGGTITKNTVSGSGKGGGIMIQTGSFTKTGGTVSGNIAPSGSGSQLYVAGGTVTVNGQTKTGAVDDEF